jgi:glycosyltransferase involved in cell wall biosynthesis
MNSERNTDGSANRNESLYIVIPAYNEEMNIEAVAREWHDVVENIGGDSRLVIINDGSKDHTYNKLQELSLQLPRLVPETKANGGHGSTVLNGYRYALDNKADYIFQTDSDGQTLPSEFPPFWEKRHDHAALIGYRNHRQDGLSRIFVTKVLKLVLRLIFRIKVTDANTPYRLMSQAVLSRYITKIPKDFNLSNVLLTVLMVDAKEDVLFLPITFRPRQGGKNSINYKRIVKIGRQAVKDFRQIHRSMKAGR